MEFLPISWRLQGKVALLAGGGEVALRKGRLLHRSGAILTVVAPQVCDELLDIVVRSGGSCVVRAFESADLDGVALVICATDDRSTNAEIAKIGRASCRERV